MISPDNKNIDPSRIAKTIYHFIISISAKKLLPSLDKKGLLIPVYN